MMLRHIMIKIWKCIVEVSKWYIWNAYELIRFEVFTQRGYMIEGGE